MSSWDGSHRPSETCSAKRLHEWLIAGVGWDWVHLARRPLFGLLYQPRMKDDDDDDDDDDDSGEVGWMSSMGNRSTLRKPATVPLCPPQIPHGFTRSRNRAAEVRSQRLNSELRHCHAKYFIIYVKPLDRFWARCGRIIGGTVNAH
jgi:hypothetical protein